MSATFTVQMEVRGGWEESAILDVSRLTEEEAADSAEHHARRLSAHWGYIQHKRWGKRSWRVWEPGDGGVDCWIRLVPDEDNPQMEEA